MTYPGNTANSCPRCGADLPDQSGDWRFCASCGAPLAGATCIRCSAPLTPGARFCHRCGTPAAAAAPAGALTAQEQSRPAGRTGWIVGGVAALALLALVLGRAVVAGDRQAAPDGIPLSSGAGANPGVVRAPDISQLSAAERADRLYNRVMLLASQGKRDSVAFFAPMAIDAYQMLGSLDEDQHYDVGRIAEVAGALPLARSHADSILQRSPTHLLGLILAARVAEVDGNPAARAEYQRRLLAAEAAELRRARPEYERHRQEISEALTAARSVTR